MGTLSQYTHILCNGHEIVNWSTKRSKAQQCILLKLTRDVMDVKMPQCMALQSRGNDLNMKAQLYHVFLLSTYYMPSLAAATETFFYPVVSKVPILQKKQKQKSVVAVVYHWMSQGSVPLWRSGCLWSAYSHSQWCLLGHSLQCLPCAVLASIQWWMHRKVHSRVELKYSIARCPSLPPTQILVAKGHRNLFSWMVGREACVVFTYCCRCFCDLKLLLGELALMVLSRDLSIWKSCKSRMSTPPPPFVIAGIFWSRGYVWVAYSVFLS